LSGTRGERVSCPITTNHGTLQQSGRLFRSDEPTQRTLLVLIHGNSYDSSYWDAGTVNGENYSFTDYANSHGFDALAVDLMGVGSSDSPGGDLVRLDMACEGVARLSARAREVDAFEDGEPRRIVLVGHSLGMIVALRTQASRAVADAVVGQATGFFSDAGPAPLAPEVRARALAKEQVLLPGAERARLFYYAPSTDPSVVLHDNAELRRTMPRRLWLDALHARSHPEDIGLEALSVPVLVQLGEHDLVAPGRVVDTERRGWPAELELGFEVLADIGHCFNLHRTRTVGWRSVIDFASR
jgi:pimeloyl-ACP methyl ester carboxylesterase